MSFNDIDLWHLQAVLLNLAIVVVLLMSMKFIKGMLASVHANKELVEKNNAAFGVSFAGGILALGIMLTGVTTGEYAETFLEEAISLGVFGVLGLVLILIGRIIQDKLVLREVNIHDELAKDNLACAFVDVGHMIAVGLIVRAVMTWIPVADFSIIPLLLVAFVLSQVIMLLASIYRVKLFKARNNGSEQTLQTTIAQGNVALAARYAAFVIGAAFAVTAASYLIPFDVASYWISAFTWAGVALLLIPVYALLVMAIRKMVLSGVDVAEEVDRQQNVGVATIEGAIFIATGLILTALI